MLTGQRQGGEDLRLCVPLKGATEAPGTPGTEDQAGQAAILWALLKNRRLTYRFNSDDDLTLESLGTAFGLVNRQVALVAVDEDQRNVTIEGSVPVSLPMPGNLAAQAMPPQMTRAGGLHGSLQSVMASMGMPPPAAAPYPSAPASAPVFAGAPTMAPARPAPPPAMRLSAQAPPPSAAPAEAKKQSVMARAAGAIRSMFSSEAEADDDVSVFEAEADEDTGRHAAAASAPLFSDDEAGLRALLLRQGADGLFDGDMGATLAAVAVLVGRGHTSREGLFRSELRRTLMTLRGQLAGLKGDERTYAALAVALLTLPGGESPPAELPATLATALAGLSLSDLHEARGKIRAALAAAPGGWQGHALARGLQGAFALT